MYGCYGSIMIPIDLNLLRALDAVLEAGSVAGAARRLGLSASATSRTLARLRQLTGDPLLVRVGRGMMPTPHALALRAQVSGVLQAVEAALAPAAPLEPASLDRCFTLRTSDGFVETFGPALLTRLRAEAPRVRLRFVQKAARNSTPLRDGGVDLEAGVVGAWAGPELHVQTLFRDRFVGVVRTGHPLESVQPGLDDYLAHPHVGVARRAAPDEAVVGPVDQALQALGRRRAPDVWVGGFATALALVRDTDLVATVPAHHTARLREGLHSFELPFAPDAITVSLLWHPRLHADPAHRWLRNCVRAVCRDRVGPAAPSPDAGH